MKKILIWSLVPAAVLLSSCDAVIVQGYGSNSANYTEGDFTRATLKGAIATTVVGDPFATRSEDFGDGVRSLMKDQVGRFPVRFVSRHGADTTKPYKVVVVFNPRQDVDNRTICRMEKQTPTVSGSPGQVSVAMVFCEGDTVRSGTSGRVGGVKDEKDHKFVSLVRQVTYSMIPPFGLQQERQHDN